MNISNSENSEPHAAHARNGGRLLRMCGGVVKIPPPPLDVKDFTKKGR